MLSLLGVNGNKKCLRFCEFYFIPWILLGEINFFLKKLMDSTTDSIMASFMVEADSSYACPFQGFHCRFAFFILESKSHYTSYDWVLVLLGFLICSHFVVCFSWISVVWRTVRVYCCILMYLIIGMVVKVLLFDNWYMRLVGSNQITCLIVCLACQHGFQPSVPSCCFWWGMNFPSTNKSHKINRIRILHINKNNLELLSIFLLMVHGSLNAF